MSRACRCDICGKLVEAGKKLRFRCYSSELQRELVIDDVCYDCSREIQAFFEEMIKEKIEQKIKEVKEKING